MLRRLCSSPLEVVQLTSATATRCSSTQTVRNWFDEGLTFKCTRCGKCCTQPTQRSVLVNELEVSTLSQASSLSPDQFVEEANAGGLRRLLRSARGDGSCVFLTDEKRCAVWENRPVACATYPFWNNHLISALDWRGAASLCEGIEVTPAVAATQPSAVNAGSESATEACLPNDAESSSFAAVSPAGTDMTSSHHPRLAVLKSMILNSAHLSNDVPGTLQVLTELVDESVDEDALIEMAESFAEDHRSIIHTEGAIDVIDSFVDGQWLRDIVHRSSPAYTQSSLKLQCLEDGRRIVCHDALPSPVFQALALVVPTWDHLQLLRRSSTPAHPHLPAQDMLADTARSSAVRVAVVGAGACALPSVLAHLDPRLLINAVDIDGDMLSIGTRFMDAAQQPRVTLHCEDGLAFIAGANDGAYDIIILDVAAPAQATSDGAGDGLCAPLPQFLGPEFLGDVAWQKLASGGLMAVNVHGSAEHAARTQALLSRRGWVGAIEVAGQSIMFGAAEQSEHIHFDHVVMGLGSHPLNPCFSDVMTLRKVADSATTFTVD